MPSSTNKAASIFNLTTSMDVGEIFYSNYFQSPVIIYSSGFSFHIAVAKSNDLTKGFSTPVRIYTPKWLPGTALAYSFHAYPALDASGKTLTLTWAESASFIRAARVTFN